MSEKPLPPPSSTDPYLFDGEGAPELRELLRVHGRGLIGQTFDLRGTSYKVFEVAVSNTTPLVAVGLMRDSKKRKLDQRHVDVPLEFDQAVWEGLKKTT